MEKLKVLILTSKFPRWKDDPQPPFTFDLARNLTAQGCDVHVIAPDADKAKKFEKIENISTYRFSYFWPKNKQKLAYGPGIPANIRTSILAKLQAPFFVISEILFAKKIIKKIDPDIVHVHWAIPQGIAASFLKKPFIMTVYGGEVFLSKNFHLVAVFNKIIKRSKKTFAITRGLRRIMEEFGIAGDIGVIPLGVDLKKFTVTGSTEIRSRFCRSDEKMILCVGRLVEKKGIHYLLPAFEQLLKKKPPCKLVIVGDGYMYPKLKQQANSLKISSNVIFAKEVDHSRLPEYYRSADLFVLPSIVDKTGNRETQGVVYLEAMASGCPVIGTRTGGIPDVIEHKKTGLMVNEKDPEALASAMLTLLDDAGLRDQLIKNALIRINDRFNWSAIAQDYIDVYRSVLG